MGFARFADAPERIARLPTDPRGFPVPWFVAWREDRPHFPVIDAEKLVLAWREELCWICGLRLGAWRAWVIGPSSALERACPEPPAHVECSEFAARHCPYLASPLARRAAASTTEPAFVKASNQTNVQTGVVALWITKGRGARPFLAGGGTLFALDEPARVAWYTNGRAAIREEVVAGLETVSPVLRKEAEACGLRAVADLQRRIDLAMRLLPHL